MISEGGSAAPRAMLFRAASPRLFNIGLATGRVRPSADKGLLDPPQAAFDHCQASRRDKNTPRMMKRTFGIDLCHSDRSGGISKYFWATDAWHSEIVRDVSTSLDMTWVGKRRACPTISRLIAALVVETKIRPGR